MSRIPIPPVTSIFLSVAVQELQRPAAHYLQTSDARVAPWILASSSSCIPGVDAKNSHAQKSLCVEIGKRDQDARANP
jgi:hypothetical protein